MQTGLIFDLQRYTLHDGHGIRTLVFLKGCPLGCLWCANPESQSNRAEIMFDARRCKGCGACLEVCPTGAIRKDEQGRLLYLRAPCRQCGACAQACPHQARRLVGTSQTVAEVLAEIERDAPFFRRTGGGVTLSGGEPLQQIDFATALLRATRERGIHTTLETSGYAPWAAVMQVVPHVDQFLFDVKLSEGRSHKRLTGVDNEGILQNLAMLSRIHDDVIVRYPLIPGYNDRESQVTAMAHAVQALGRVRRVELLPYHRYGEHKYEMLGREYPLTGVLPPATERIEWACRLVRSAGPECRVLHHHSSTGDAGKT